MKLGALNALDRAAFVTALGGIFEHSPWIADAVYEHRPFPSVDRLHATMLDALRGAPERQMALLQAHPELGRTGRALTASSAAEQTGMGLDRLAEAEAVRLESLNRDYRERFGFPFIIAVRGARDPAAIIASLEARLTATEAEERMAALAEIGKIARFRLDDLIEPEGRLTVHVLDTARGRPGGGMVVALYRLDKDERRLLGQFRTNDDGRCDPPLLQAEAVRPGVYELEFAVAAWRQATGQDPGFYDRVPIRFTITDPGAHYHVPLILAPFGYSTYRGS